MPTGVPISMIAVLAGLGVGIYFTQAVWRRHRRKESVDGRAIALCGIGWTVALGSFIVTEPAYIFVARVSGVPNLAWLIGYWFLVLNLYCITMMLSITMHLGATRIRRAAYLMVVAMVILALIFFVGDIAFAPINLTRTLPRSFSELLYIGFTQSYLVFVFAEPLLMTIKIASEAGSSNEARIRASILFLVFFSGIAYSILRILLTLSAYHSLIVNENLLAGIQVVSLVFFAVTLLVWPFAFVPSKWIRTPYQLHQLHQLTYLYRRIKASCIHEQVSIVDIPNNWWSQLARYQFYMDAISVFLLDVKWLLNEGSLEISDRNISAIVNSLDETLPRDQFILQCAIASRSLQQFERRRIGGYYVNDK